MEKLSEHFDSLGFRDRLNEVYHVSRFLEDFVGAVSADKWHITDEALYGMFTIYFSLNAAIDGLRKDAEKLKNLT